MVRNDLDFDKALQNPKAVFGTPERVLNDDRLDRADKRAILERWEQDERELAVAEEEGMGGGEGSMMARVVRARHAVAAERDEGSVAATKHRGGSEAGGSESPAPSRVEDLMRVIDDVVHVDEDLHEAYIRMRQSGAPFLPVADGDEIVGVLTARDIYGEPQPVDGDKTAARVREHLSMEVAFCHQHDDVQTARAVMDCSGHHRLLVVDDEDQLVGFITLEAIAAALPHLGSERPGASRPRAAKVEDRLVEAGGRAKGDKPGQPWTYAVRPKLKT